MANNTNPSVVGKKHKEAMRAHYARLEGFNNDAFRWLEQIDIAHREFYTVIMASLEESDNPEDFQAWQHLDLQYVQMMSSLQAARERLVEATAHIKRALVHPGDNNAHLKNVTQDTFK